MRINTEHEIYKFVATDNVKALHSAFNKDPSIIDAEYEIEDLYSSTPPVVENLMTIAAKHGSWKVVKWLYEKRPNFVIFETKPFESSYRTCEHPIIAASEQGHLKIVQFFLEIKPSLLTYQTRYGNTILGIAMSMSRNHMGIIKYLLTVIRNRRSEILVIGMLLQNIQKETYLELKRILNRSSGGEQTALSFDGNPGRQADFTAWDEEQKKKIILYAAFIGFLNLKLTSPLIKTIMDYLNVDMDPEEEIGIYLDPVERDQVYNYLTNFKVLQAIARQEEVIFTKGIDGRSSPLVLKNMLLEGHLPSKQDIAMVQATTKIVSLEKQVPESQPSQVAAPLSIAPKSVWFNKSPVFSDKVEITAENREVWARAIMRAS